MAPAQYLLRLAAREDVGDVASADAEPAGALNLQEAGEEAARLQRKVLLGCRLGRAVVAETAVLARELLAEVGEKLLAATGL